jgi:hypothetical protein
LVKINLQDLIKVLSEDVLKNNSCIEINFCIDNDVEYEDCWMGKMPDKNNVNKEIYWYGLVADGSQGYDYDCLEDILNAKVFKNKSICDIWESITLYSLNGCDVEEMLQY